MDRRHLILGCLLGSAGFASRSDAAQKTQGGPHPQRAADAERSFAASMAKRDPKAFASHISEEAIFMGAADGPTLPQAATRTACGLRHCVISAAQRVRAAAKLRALG